MQFVLANRQVLIAFGKFLDEIARLLSIQNRRMGLRRRLVTPNLRLGVGIARGSGRP